MHIANVDNAASEYDDESDEDEEEEEDPNEICRKLYLLCSELHVPIQLLCVMFKLFSKLRNGDYIK